MGIFLGFSNAQLGQSVLGDVVAKGIGQAGRMVGNGQARVIVKGLVILGQGDVGQWEMALGQDKTGKIWLHEATGDFAGPVGAEIEEDYTIVGLDGRDRIPIFRDDGRNDKFIHDASFIGCSDCSNGIGGLIAFTHDHRTVGFFDTIPAIVAIHGIVAAHDRGNLADSDLLELCFQFLGKTFGRIRRDIAAVKEAVDIDIFQSLALGQLDQGIQVGVVAVDAAV